MARSPLTPDRRLEIALTGTARRHALADTPDPAAIAELRLLADGRRDLLAEAAGRTLGAWHATPLTADPRELRIAWLLVAAGADPPATVTHADTTRARLARGDHSTPNTDVT